MLSKTKFIEWDGRIVSVRGMSSWRKMEDGGVLSKDYVILLQ